MVTNKHLGMDELKVVKIWQGVWGYRNETDTINKIIREFSKLKTLNFPNFKDKSKKERKKNEI